MIGFPREEVESLAEEIWLTLISEFASAEEISKMLNIPSSVANEIWAGEGDFLTLVKTLSAYAIMLQFSL